MIEIHDRVTRQAYQSSEPPWRRTGNVFRADNEVVFSILYMREALVPDLTVFSASSDYVVESMEYHMVANIGFKGADIHEIQRKENIYHSLNFHKFAAIFMLPITPQQIVTQVSDSVVRKSLVPGNLGRIVIRKLGI